MIKHSKVHTAVDRFLAKRVKSTGGWAPVQNSELMALVEIIDQLIHAKYQADPDGDYPIDYCIVDRTTCEPMNFRGLPYSPKFEGDKAILPKDVLIEAFRFEVARYNLDLAMSQFRETIKPVQIFIQDFAESATEIIAEELASKNPVDVLE